MNIAIVGCGASALYFSAINKDDNITIFEKNKKIASKLLASGNGKCNVMNISATPDDYNNAKFMTSLFSMVSPNDIYNTLGEMGLLIKKDDEGRCYPVSESSLTVLNILLKNSKAKIITEYKVESIKRVNGKYMINDYKTLFDKVILASGSNASIIKGKDMDCYNYLSCLNIKLTKLKPSLTGFMTKSLKEISGVRVKANVSLYTDKLIRSEAGEVIFKDDGISGIVIMNMSSYLNKVTYDKAYVEIDLIPGYDYKDLEGALNPVLYSYIMKNKLNPHKLRLDIIKTYDKVSAQVISGGVSLDEINSDFSLKKDNNIYLMGEMLDIDGKCGGYNLLFAFSSATVVERSIK